MLPIEAENSRSGQAILDAKNLSPSFRLLLDWNTSTGMAMLRKLRQLAGVQLLDRPRYRRLLTTPGHGYLALCNRYEQLRPSPLGNGYECCWHYTSRLHAPSVCPDLGQRLLQRCLRDFPIVCLSEPAWDPGLAPELSVVIPHRGSERVGHLLATLQSVAAQRNVRLECIVLEQDSQSEVAALLPAWVRHVLSPLQLAGGRFNRSHAFNEGLRHCRAPVALLHDNDMLIPDDYCRSIMHTIALGYQAVNLKRFVFYLDKSTSLAIMARPDSPLDVAPPLDIVQNLEAGGSVAITVEAYRSIGGMDEEFQGWGGEDNEFWDRAALLSRWTWGLFPIVHLWHRPQELKHHSGNTNLQRAHALAQVPAQKRIEQLIHANSFS